MKKVLTTAITFGFLLLPAMASAQSDAPVDSIGNLTDMPFELDIPVTRTAVDQGPDYVSFVHYTTMSVDDLCEHYDDYFVTQRELGPGWTIIGRGFNIGSSSWYYTVRYADQRYILEIASDTGGGAIVSLRGQVAALGNRPYLHTVMPYRALDVGGVEYTTQ